jgi:hypothetical protein
MRRTVSLLLAALTIVLATACLPTHPRPAPGPGWNTHSIARGQHNATVQRGRTAPAPLLAFTNVPGRIYHLIFDASARYVLTDPTEPEDQLDWNKLPGLSDCGDTDLARNGLMFAWRWRTDTVPRRLEINAYANQEGVHHWLDQPMLTLNRAQVDARKPIWFRLRISNDRRSYEFTLRTVIGGREIVRSARLDRSCPARSRTVPKWAGGYYFGGTSVAPTPMRVFVYEPR